MCGIAGIWHLDKKPLSKNKISDFTNSMSHRGPDGFDYYIDEAAELGFGHRRLAILDLTSSGDQPFSYADGRYWMVFNGEIYNFLELREELKRYGYNFQSDSDTEVVLAAYDRWGKECLEKFNGMWAFAIWDTKKQTLFLARDRFGIKPLYYTFEHDTFFAFASETIAFKRLHDFQRRIDSAKLTKAIEDPFSLEGIGHTIFEQIFSVLPGHYVEYIRGGAFTQKRWWSTIEHIEKPVESYESQVEQFKNMFEDACRLRMRSDVPIATALSGGVDSSSVYAMLYTLMQKDIDRNRIPSDWRKAIVATLPGTALDESEYAKQVADKVGGDVRYIEPDYSHLVETIIHSTIHFDSIYITPLNIAGDIYKSMRENGVKVSLDGHGVDEMLYGYPHLVLSAYKEALWKKQEDTAKDIESVFINMFAKEKQPNAESMLRAESRLNKLVQDQYGHLVPSFVKNIKKLLRHSWLRHRTLSSLQPIGESAEHLNTLSATNRNIYSHFHTHTLPTILRNFDRASMQNGIEVRMPFMDWRLVSFVFSLPVSSKLGGGYTKRILRDSMKGILPETIRQRTLKIGLNAPMVEWFSGAMKECIQDEVHSDTFLQSSIWDGKEIADFVDAKMKTGWNWDDCTRFWPYLNAHILLKNNNV